MRITIPPILQCSCKDQINSQCKVFRTVCTKYHISVSSYYFKAMLIILKSVSRVCSLYYIILLLCSNSTPPRNFVDLLVWSRYVSLCNQIGCSSVIAWVMAWGLVDLSCTGLRGLSDRTFLFYLCTHSRCTLNMCCIGCKVCECIHMNKPKYTGQELITTFIW